MGDTGGWRGQNGKHTWQRMTLPFFMAYPDVLFQEEDAVMRDLEYLIQLYPERAEKYLRTISHMLDHLDYRGSLIYDEYPDRLALFRLADSVEEQIRREEAPAALAEPQEAGGLIKREGESGAETQDRKALVQILLYYEIFRRRRKIRQNAGCVSG